MWQKCPLPLFQVVKWPFTCKEWVMTVLIVPPPPTTKYIYILTFLGLRSRSCSRSPVRAALGSDRAPQADGLSVPVPVTVQQYNQDQSITHYHDPRDQQVGEVKSS